MIDITPDLQIDEAALEYRFKRASGPGGQNVNKTDSAVQLRFDTKVSPQLPWSMLLRLERLAGQRMTKQGVVVIHAERFRTQERNRADALERLMALLIAAAHVDKPRRPTRPTLASRRRRQSDKSRRSALKSSRRSEGAD